MSKGGSFELNPFPQLSRSALAFAAPLWGWAIFSPSASPLSSTGTFPSARQGS